MVCLAKTLIDGLGLAILLGGRRVLTSFIRPLSFPLSDCVDAESPSGRYANYCEPNFESLGIVP